MNEVTNPGYNDFLNAAKTRSGEPHKITTIIRNLKNKVIFLKGTLTVGNIELNAVWRPSGVIEILNGQPATDAQVKDYSLYVIEKL